jgi:hypothetical protein
MDRPLRQTRHIDRTWLIHDEFPSSGKFPGAPLHILAMYVSKKAQFGAVP